MDGLHIEFTWEDFTPDTHMSLDKHDKQNVARGPWTLYVLFYSAYWAVDKQYNIYILPTTTSQITFWLF